MVSAPLIHFQEKFKQAATVKDKTAALYGLLQETGAWERMESWSEEALKKGNAEKAREHLQVYRGVVELMDQLVEIMGEEKISSSFYARILETGMESLRLSLVPPSLDQVLVGNVERSRPGRVSWFTCWGLMMERSHRASETVSFRGGTGNHQGLGADPAREASGACWMNNSHLHGPDPRFRRALDCYSLADEEGRALLPSPLIARIKKIFPSLKERLLSGEPEGGQAAVKEGSAALARDEGKEGSFPTQAVCERSAGEVAAGIPIDIDAATASAADIDADAATADDADIDAVAATADDVDTDAGVDTAAGAGTDAVAADNATAATAAYLLHYIADPRRTLSHLSVQLGRFKKGERIHPLWWDVYNWFARQERWREPSKRLLSGIFHENRERPIRPETGLELYGRHLRASVSRLERFRSCPFSHFVSRTAPERAAYLPPEAPDIGRFSTPLCAILPFLGSWPGGELGNEEYCAWFTGRWRGFYRDCKRKYCLVQAATAI